MRSECSGFRRIALTAGFILAAAVFAGCAFRNVSSSAAETTAGNTELTEPSTIVTETETEETTPSPTPTDVPTPTEEPEPSATPTPVSVKVSFIGDCTLCSDARGRDYFSSVVKKRWDYPFKHCKYIFKADDLTLANCEMAITSRKKYRKKKFVFAMKPAGIAMFTKNGIEAVNLANNHTMDFGSAGYKDTQRNLTKAKVLWSDCTHYSIYTAKNGVKIGMCGYTNSNGLSKTYNLIKQLRAKGCQIVIVSCHWGVEAKYKPTKSQIKRGRALISHGADIVVGTHPHRLQPIEVYKGKYILYSIGNFCFGGHTNPSDPDTAIVQCTFVLDDERKNVTDYRLNVIPFSLRSTKKGNDYCPKPYTFESKDYDRVMSRLNWAQGDE